MSQDDFVQRQLDLDAYKQRLLRIEAQLNDRSSKLESREYLIIRRENAIAQREAELGKQESKVAAENENVPAVADSGSGCTYLFVGLVTGIFLVGALLVAVENNFCDSDEISSMVLLASVDLVSSWVL